MLYFYRAASAAYSQLSPSADTWAPKCPFGRIHTLNSALLDDLSQHCCECGLERFVIKYFGKKKFIIDLNMSYILRIKKF